MKNNLLALVVTLVLESVAFGAWNVECTGPQGATLVFSETSFFGEPFLMIHSANFSFNLQGRAQIQISLLFDGKTNVWAMQYLRPGDYLNFQQINFSVPTDLFPNSLLGVDLPFDMMVNLERGRGRKTVLKEQFPMYCRAKSVVFV